MTWSVKREDGSSGAGQRADFAAQTVSGEQTMSVESLVLRDAAPAGVLGRAWVPVDPGLTVSLSGSQKLAVKTVRCYHSVADVGYVVGEMKKVLRGVTPDDQIAFEELKERSKQKDRQAGQDMAKMRVSGRVAECEEFLPKVAYLCDTTIQVFGPCPTCAASKGCHACPFSLPEISPNGSPCDLSEAAAHQAEVIFSSPTIIVECTFLGAAGMTEEQSESEAMKRGHVSWAQLRPTVLNHPEITFILVHFSERYKDAQIRSYFAAGPANVVLWLDSGVTKCSDLTVASEGTTS